MNCSTQHTPTRGRTPPRKRLYATGVGSPQTTAGPTPRRAVLEVVSPQVVDRRLFSTEEVPSNEIPIGMEQEVPYGNVCERREFIFEEPAVQEPEVAPTSLPQCVSNGVLHMDRAARLIWEKTQQCVFNQATYDEFVNSEVAGRAVFKFDGLYRMGDPQAIWHNFVALRLQADINRGVSAKHARRAELTEETVAPNSSQRLSMENCEKTWRIAVQPPFGKVELTNVAENWQPRKNDNTFQQIASLFRYVLLRITSPPEKIKEFSVRINRSGGKNGLKDLPIEVEAVLIGFVEDALGYGHDELNKGYPINKEESGFYQQLGRDEKERSDNLEAMVQERKRWRPHLFKGLQKALRDVRCYEYDKVEQKWKPSNVRFSQT
ncbi:hypothetical protein ANCCAN_05383 [Ancylostoma caninum]|uniref:Uncharacterized protein n=1 Tax=Ancylostoma caninum TaxID=29170 RepID=A0A368GW14_ANCCA|nr:hypothetical protein ANCCAN_05383 [Ancylostoma caninum]